MFAASVPRELVVSLSLHCLCFTRVHPRRRRGAQGTGSLWSGRPRGSRGASRLPLKKISKRCREHTGDHCQPSPR